MEGSKTPVTENVAMEHPVTLDIVVVDFSLRSHTELFLNTLTQSPKIEVARLLLPPLSDRAAHNPRL